MASSGISRPPGDYPGDRSYIGFFIAGALMGLAAIFSVLPGSITLVLFGISTVLLLSMGYVGLTNARTKRFELWNRVATELAPADHSRILDVASRDLLGGATLVRANPQLFIAVVPDPRDAELVESNLAAVRAVHPATDPDDGPDEVEASDLGDLPLEDASFNYIVSDSSRALLKRAKLDAALAEMIRLAAPGAQIAIVIASQTKRIRAGLEAAGATDISIENVLGTAWTGYRLVRARFPEAA